MHAGMFEGGGLLGHQHEGMEAFSTSGGQPGSLVGALHSAASALALMWDSRS